MRRLLLPRPAALLLAAVLLTACGSSAEEPPPMLPPATPAPALEGVWCGPAQDRTGRLGSVCITMDAVGNVTRLSIDNRSNGALGTIQATSEGGIFRFVMSDGTLGWLGLSASGDHLFYLDSFRTLAALDKTSSGLPAIYLLGDLLDVWAGRSLHLDPAGEVLGTASSGMAVMPAFVFSGQDGPADFGNQPGISLIMNNAQFGRYSGRYERAGGTRGDLLLLMAADKAFVVGQLCDDGGSFPQDCSLVFWERAR